MRSWRPDDALATVERRDLATTEQVRDEDDELCMAGTVKVHHVKESSEVSDSGTTYYRCGGGRRVIRKRIGGD